MKKLNRRSVLRGAGVTLSLPFLEAMLPFNRSWAAPAPRFASLYMGNGTLSGQYRDGFTTSDFWSCRGTANGITSLSQPMQLLADHRQYLTLVQNCSFTHLEKTSAAAGHEQAAPGFLCGQNIADDAGNILPNSEPYLVSRLAGPGMSIDRMIAGRQGTRLRSLMMGVGSADGRFFNPGIKPQMLACLSWDSQTAHLFNETIRTSAEVFNRLVSSGLSSATDTGGQARLQQRKSVLDSVLGDINQLMQRLGNADRQIMNQYLTSLRQVEMDLQNSSTAGTCAQPANASNYTTLTRIDYSTVTRTAQNMIEMMALAFQCGITNVATLMLSYDYSEVPGAQYQSAYGTPNVSSPSYHNTSHWNSDHADNGGLPAMQGIQLWHARQLAHLARIFAATPDSDGRNLLDNSMVLFGSGMGDPAEHNYQNMVRVLLGRGAGLNPGPNGKIINAGGGDAHPKLLQTLLTGFGITTRVGMSGGATLPGIIG